MERFPSIDLIKALASFFVTAVHFRNRIETEILVESLTPKMTAFFSMNYALFVIAVPLFILVSGFLSTRIKPNKKLYINILNVYSRYIFMSLISYQVMVLFGIREPRSLLKMISLAMKFDLISGWYIELYVSLMLIAPYLNILVDSLSRTQFKRLIITLIISITLPPLINTNTNIFRAIYLPSFWPNLYPVVYYVIGNYIFKYKDEIVINRLKLLVVMLISIFFIFFTVYSEANPYTWAADGYYQSIIQVILSTSFFLFIFSFRNLPDSNLVKFISSNTLNTYIVSLPIDRILYTNLILLLGDAQSLIKFSPLVVIVSFFIALLVGCIISFLFDLLWKFLYSSIGKFV